MIAFERSAELVGNAFAQSYFVVLEAIARLAPNETKQAEGVTSDSHRGYQRGSSAKRCIEHHSQRQREIRFVQLKGFALRQDVYHRGIFRDVERLAVSF